MHSVSFRSPYNATTFTTCCGTVIGGERCCPGCGEEIDGYNEDKSSQDIMNTRFRIAFNKECLIKDRVRKSIDMLKIRGGYNDRTRNN